MYTRCSSIASLFQKTALLRDAKRNTMFQRRMHSMPILKFYKIENKLKPMKRCFSGGPNNRNSMHKTRHIQGVGFIRKNIAKTQRLSEQMPPNVGNQGITMDRQTLNGSTQKSGTITIIIDRNEICNCASPGEDIQIHVTTKPDASQKKSLGKALSETALAQLCSTKCGCCPRCEEVKNLKIQSAIPIRMSNTATCQSLKTPMNFPNHFPIRRQVNDFGSPVRNFTGLGDTRQMAMLRNSRSMSHFPVMRKMIMTDSSGKHIPQSARRMHKPSVHDARSQIRPMSTSVHEQQNLQPKQNPISLTNLQTENYRSIIPNQQMVSHSLDVLEKERNARKMNEIDRQVRKYSSFHRNVLPPMNPPHNSDASHGANPKPGKELSRSGPNIDQQRQPMKITERILRPATFSSVGHVIDNRSITSALNVSRALWPANSPNQTLRGPFIKNPLLFNLNESVGKNRLPSFQRQNVFLTPKRGYAGDGLRNINRAGSRTSVLSFGPILNTNRTNIPLKQRSTSSISPGNFAVPRKMLHQNHFLVHRQPPLLHHQKSRAKLQPSMNPNHRMNNQLPMTNRPKKLIPMNPLSVRQPPQFFLKKKSAVPVQFRLIPKLRAPRPVRPNQVSNVGSAKRPPLYFLRRRSAVPAMQQYQKKHFQPPQTRAVRRNVFDERNLPKKEHSNMVSIVRNKMRIPKQASMIPVRYNPVQRTMPPINPPQHIPIVPFERFVDIQHKNAPQPQQVNRNHAIDPTTQPRAKAMTDDQRPPSDPRRIFVNQFQSSLPVAITNQQNRIGKFIERPKSAQLAGRLYSDQANVRAISRPYSNQSCVNPPRPQQMCQLRQIAVPVNGLKFLPNELRMPLPMVPPMSIQKSLPPVRQIVEEPRRIIPRMNAQGHQRMPQPRPMIPPMNPQKSMSQEREKIPQPRQTSPPMNEKESSDERSFQPKKISSKDSQLVVAAPTVNDSNLRKNNPAVLFSAPGRLELVDIPVPRLADEKGVIVKMLYVHLTDVDGHMLSAIEDGPYKLTQPTIAGKSGSGIVVDVGKQVDNVKIGDKVSVKGISCGKCTACENDNDVICERVTIGDKLGILKRFHAVSAKFVTKLPDQVHPIDGAMIDELSSSIRACKKSAVTAGDNVLVLGGKSLGLWTALAAKSMGATKVCLADSRPSVLDQAKKLGIERVFLMNPDSVISDTSKAIAEYMDKENPRIVFDCNGSPLTNEIAIKTSQIGGKVVLMKNSITHKPVFLSDAVDREIDILSSQHGNNDSERAALQLLSSGKVKLNGIESSFFDITNVHEAFQLLNSGTISNIFIQPSQLDSNGKKKSETLREN